jgi:uncharacterized protein
MLREQLAGALKEAMNSRDERAVATIRLILAALKDREIAARGSGRVDVIGDGDILQMLQAMIQQRRECIALYEQSGRVELAEQEGEEIGIIERFLPPQLSEEEMRAAVEATVAELGAHSLKETGRIMASLKEKYAGRMDFSRASRLVRERLA